LVIVLAVVAIGGFFAVNWYRNKDAGATTAKTTNGPNGKGAANSAPATIEFGKYWLEVLPNASIAEPMRVAGSVPLKSGQAFKFHLQPQDEGYVYIVGPGDGSKPTAFLTEQPATISGLTTNRAAKGEDFSFPSGIEHWLELDKKPGTEDYTVIFSPQPLTSPTFFRAEATGKPLSETERSEFEAFVARFKTGQPVTELNNDDPAGPSVVVKVPASKEAGAPVVFDVRIQHK